MHPYPYGDGFTRDLKACNIDRSDLGSSRVHIGLSATHNGDIGPRLGQCLRHHPPQALATTRYQCPMTIQAKQI